MRRIEYDPEGWWYIRTTNEDTGATLALSRAFHSRDEVEHEYAQGSYEAGWTHDPQRDGAGCTWCGAYAQVDSDNLCRLCYPD